MAKAYQVTKTQDRIEESRTSNGYNSICSMAEQDCAGAKNPDIFLNVCEGKDKEKCVNRYLGTPINEEDEEVTSDPEVVKIKDREFWSFVK